MPCSFQNNNIGKLELKIYLINIKAASKFFYQLAHRLHGNRETKCTNLSVTRKLVIYIFRYYNKSNIKCQYYDFCVKYSYQYIILI